MRLIRSCKSGKEGGFAVSHSPSLFSLSLSTFCPSASDSSRLFPISLLHKRSVVLLCAWEGWRSRGTEGDGGQRLQARLTQGAAGAFCFLFGFIAYQEILLNRMKYCKNLYFLPFLRRCINDLCHFPLAFLTFFPLLSALSPSLNI